MPFRAGESHSAQARRDNLIPTHSEERVPLDERVEIHRIEILPLGIRQARDVARSNLLGEPF